MIVQVPSGVLSVLPGPGREVGAALASHPLVIKVDITVGAARSSSHIADIF